jgi:hypothetical protein
MGTQSNGTIELVAEGSAQKVVWTDQGDLGMNPVFRWFGLFIEKIIAPDFERGLANIKKLVEK